MNRGLYRGLIIRLRIEHEDELAAWGGQPDVTHGLLGVRAHQVGLEEDHVGLEVLNLLQECRCVPNLFAQITGLIKRKSPDLT